MGLFGNISKLRQAADLGGRIASVVEELGDLDANENKIKDGPELLSLVVGAKSDFDKGVKKLVSARDLIKLDADVISKKLGMDKMILLSMLDDLPDEEHLSGGSDHPELA